VRFDKIELSERTPLAVERDRDDNRAHDRVRARRSQDDDEIDEVWAWLYDQVRREAIRRGRHAQDQFENRPIFR